MKTLDTVKSNDGATKYVVEYDDKLVGEATYIKYPNKDIVCVPTQVACRMGCKFCHLSNDPGLVNRNLSQYEMEDLVFIVATENSGFRRPLLVSFMGSGEPMLNWDAMFRAMVGLTNDFGPTAVRFAFATMVPRGSNKALAFRLADAVKEAGLNAKAHLSLHFTDDKTRWRYMPNASSISDSLMALESYMNVTGCDAEVHYTLIDDVNDGPQAIADLARLIHPKIGIKILHYSQNKNLVDKYAYPLKPSMCPNEFVFRLKELGYKAEYYKPNGLDIGSSCGQFDLSKYRRKNDLF